MMLPSLKSLFPAFPQPAFAFAGAVSFLPAPCPAGRVDSFSMAPGSVAQRPVAPVLSHISLFAAAGDDATLVGPPEIDAGDAAAADAGAAAPPEIVYAYDVHMALFNIPFLHRVILDDPKLVEVIAYRGWIKEVTDGEREAMKKISAGLESAEAELAKVEEELVEYGPLLKRAKAFAGSLLEMIKPGRTQRVPVREALAESLGLNLTGVIRTLKARRRELEADVVRSRIAKEWLDHTAWSAYGYILLTDSGRKVLAALERSKGDPKMEYTSIDDYLAEISANKR